ncbi:FkbM family methyltransferase [Phenylobacterium soli]|uniref:Methyltransferase FkbM domain-containing protein n=1 Tax=Phenylobacterium soli TaxID=2170551 RepID=A0A328A9J0_9CAUL|nr:FkbM family methyltransferase [Phenylobacterium soli]RAK51199.1 hypothetical protein DJ017_19770 [Phenylobacterium soli]
MSDVMVRIGDLWWPAADRDARPVIVGDCAPAIAALLPHIVGREAMVQAGGNVGTYPIALAKHFKRVWTAEPEPTNYDCLELNLQAHDPEKRVTALRAAFGEKLGSCRPLIFNANNCGAHQVTFDKGETPVWTIDELELDACDCIWGDVEGSELFMLKGAEGTIEKFSPTIAIEDKGLHRHFGIPDGEIQRWLAERGYSEVARIGNDKVFRRTS